MQIIFCSEPFFPLQVDSAYETEFQTAKQLGFEVDLIDFESLIEEEDSQKAIRKVAKKDNLVAAIYRGWMLKPNKYKQLFDSLAERNINLINSPEEYKHCHYLPESYSLIENYTPATVYIEIDKDVDFDKIFQLLSRFGNKPIILKDYVKSRKHEWNEACFISSASNHSEVERVVKRFIELQDEDLNEGLVFREFIEFQPLAEHSKSNMPLTKEFRLFFLNGKLLDCFEYWDEGDYSKTYPPQEIFTDVAQNIKSKFFTMDIAQSVNGKWYIVELGDGQVSGLPENANTYEFYQKLKNSF